MVIANLMKRPMVQAAALAAACLLASGALASAFLINADGSIETASVLYESGPGGANVKIAEVGDAVTDGGVVSEIGRPAIAPDGLIAFGAEVVSNGHAAWTIFENHPGGVNESLSPILKPEGERGECRPDLRIDPEVAIAADESIYFLAPDQRRHGTLFRYAHGRLDCLVSDGDRTAQGHSILAIHLGSAKAAQNGAVVFKARLLPDVHHERGPAREAILLSLPGQRVGEIALEGARSPGGGRYLGHFGAPAITAERSDVIVSFTDRDAHGKSALYMGPPRRLTRTVATGAMTAAGPLTYLSDSAPGMSAGGCAAIRAASGARSMILAIRDGEWSVAAREGDPVSAGWSIWGLDDPMFSAAGEITVEASDQAGRSHILRVPASANGDEPAVIDPGSIPLFPHSLAIGASGRSVFLASPAHPPDRAPEPAHDDARDGSI